MMCLVCYRHTWFKPLCSHCKRKVGTLDGAKLRIKFVKAHMEIIEKANNPTFELDLVFPVYFRDYWDLLDRHNCRILQNIQYKFRRYVKVETQRISEELLRYKGVNDIAKESTSQLPKDGGTIETKDPIPTNEY